MALKGLQQVLEVTLQPYHQYTPHMLNYFEDSSSWILLQLTASSLQVNSLGNKLRYHWLYHFMFQRMPYRVTELAADKLL